VNALAFPFSAQIKMDFNYRRTGLRSYIRQKRRGELLKKRLYDKEKVCIILARRGRLTAVWGGKKFVLDAIFLLQRAWILAITVR
jgi:hypothetical protein